jgi:hypothetical protein
MRRKLSLVVLLVATFCSLYAQKKSTTVTADNADEKRRSYIGLSSGINNISGMGGITFETPFSNNFSAKIGAGFGGWGVKLGVAAKYYKQYAKSWSFGLGYSTASGSKELSLQLSKASSPDITQDIKMKLERAHMLDLVAGKSWGNKVKFNLEFGYAIQVGGGAFETIDRSVVLSEASTSTLNLLSPKGLILGLGVMFRL